MERETRRLLRQHDDFSEWVDRSYPSDAKVSILNAGHGQFPLLFALVHPDVEVHSYTYDADQAALAAACEPMPQNLHVHFTPDEAAAVEAAKDTTVIRA